ncbi:MAG TPA: MarR family transcriptional regulator [Clostridiales bacterium]|jgi:DNA-binding MarR family transcriptional regulator|nr:MarR family transcriptional regulator [Clostridiales bacterium]
MDEFEKSLNDILVNTFNNILKYEEASLKTIADIPVTMAEAHMIEAISKRGGQSTVSDIANDLNITPPTATVAVKKLEKKGFVIKVPFSKDGRRFIISLTRKGEKVDRAHSIFHRRMVRNISRKFTDTEKNILLVAVKKLGDFFGEKAKVFD